MLENIILTSGDEALTLNNQIVLTMSKQAGDDRSAIDEAGENLAQITGMRLSIHHMQTPSSGEWTWREVLASRALTFGIDVPTDAMVECLDDAGVQFGGAFAYGHFFYFEMDQSGLPATAIGNGISGKFPSQNEAILAAYEWVKGGEIARTNPSAEVEQDDRPKFFRTTIMASFLSQDLDLSGMNLAEMVEEAGSGELVMHAHGTSVTQLTAAEVAAALYAAGSDPNFFQLNEDGSLIDHDDDDAPAPR